MRGYAVYINELQFVQMIKLNKTGGFFGLALFVQFSVFSYIYLLVYFAVVCYLCEWHKARHNKTSCIFTVPLSLARFDSLTRSTSSYVLLKGTRGFCLFLSYRFTAFSYAFMAFCYFLERNVVALPLKERLLSNKIYCFTSMECRRQ